MGLAQNIDGHESLKKAIGAHIEENRIYLRDKFRSTQDNMRKIIVYRQCQKRTKSVPFGQMSDQFHALPCKSCQVTIGYTYITNFGLCCRAILSCLCKVVWQLG